MYIHTISIAVWIRDLLHNFLPWSSVLDDSSTAAASMSLNQATKRQRPAKNFIMVNVSVKLKADFRFDKWKMSRTFYVGFVIILSSTTDICVRYPIFYIIGVRYEVLVRMNYWSLSIANNLKNLRTRICRQRRMLLGFLRFIRYTNECSISSRTLILTESTEMFHILL